MSKKLAGFGAAGLILLLLTLVVSLGIGSVHLPVREIGAMLLHRLPGIGDSIVPGWEASSEQILMKVRLPRILLGMLVGASLAVAGAAFQGVLRNPLADPFTLGVSSGAALGAASLIFSEWNIPLPEVTHCRL